MISFTSDLSGIGESQLAGFFEGWPNPPTPETHLRLLRGSTEVLLAVDDATGNVVGFANAISDGVLSAYIPLLEVLTDHRGRGIGSELMRLLLKKLEHYYMIDLLCDADVQPFYERLGMTRVGGMMRRNYSRQSGT